jgi:LysR family hydrogen peroxide-inducible transcriptional activator
MISLQQMQYILALNDFGQFQKASESCFVTQPTLSMQVKKAEEVLGHKIFNRSSSPLTLTSFGEKLIPVLRDMMIENSRIDQLVQKTNGTFVEKIRVGVIPTIASYLVPALFQSDQVRAEEVIFSFKEMHTRQLIEKLANGELDMMILAGPFQQPGMQSIKLYEEEIKAYVQERTSDEISSEEIKLLKPWLLTEGNCLRTQMVSFCGITSDSGLNQWDYEGGNLDLLMRMVDTQGGYTLVPEYCYSDNGRSATLSSIRIDENGLFPSRTIIAVYPNKTVYKSSLEKLIHVIQQIYFKSGDKLLNSIGWQGD